MTLYKSAGSLWRGIGGASPKGFFASGELGGFWDFNDRSGLSQDSGGASPVTTPAQPVGRVLDRSGRGNNLLQASAGLRPLYGKAFLGARRNLLSDTNLMAGWSKSKAGTGVMPTITDNAEVAPDGTLTAARIVLDKGVGATSGDYAHVSTVAAVTATSAYAISVWVRTTDGTTKSVQFRDDSSNLINQIITVTPVWQRFSANGLAATGAVALKLWLRGTQGTSDSASLAIWGGQLEAGSTITTAQIVSSTGLDMRETGAPAFGLVRPDLSDDVLAVTFATGFTGDVALFGRLGSRIISGQVIANGGTLTIGPTAATGFAAGTLAALGDLCGAVAISRALTVAERAKALAYFAAQGAGGWI